MVFHTRKSIVRCMKCIRSLVVALSLTVATFTTGSAQAEPHKESPLYYLLGANAQQASLMSTAVEHQGDVTEAWVLVYLPLPISTGDKDGTTFQAMWFLTDYNCRDSTAAIKRLDVMAPDWTRIASLPGNGKFSPPVKGSMASLALQLACDRDYPAKVLTAREAALGLARYSRAAQAALAAGAQKNEEKNADQD